MTNKILKKTVFILLLSLKIPAPISAQDFEVSPVIVYFTADPGETQKQTIYLYNHSNQNSKFSISLTDFILNKEGKTVIMAAGSTEHSLANWLSINPPFVELAPNESTQITLSVQTSANDYLSRWANILVRSTKEQTAFSVDKQIQTGINIQGQIAIKVYQSPKSNHNYKMKITGLTEITTKNDTIRRFKVLVDNIGEKITDCKITLLANNISNGKETIIQTYKFITLPEGQREIELKMPKDALPPGKYALAAILDYGKQSNLEGTQMIITVD